MKKYAFLLITVLTFSMLLVGSTSAECNLNLPTTQVNMNAVNGTISYFDITLSDVPSGFDVTNRTYLGWCIDRGVTMPRETTFAVNLYSSCDPPEGLETYQWNKINYILNNKPDTATADEIQQAIWYYINLDESDPPFEPTLPGAQAIIDDAELYGEDFVPESYQIVAVILIPVSPDLPEPAQSTIIEVKLPRNEGLSPGFWKNHPDCWIGYSPDQKFSDVFGPTHPSLDDLTLMEVLNLGGGVNEEKGVYAALGRHAVAALLNAAHPDVHYPWTEDEVIQKVAEAIGNVDDDDAEPLKNILDEMNNLGGGIDAHCKPISKDQLKDSTDEIEESEKINDEKEDKEIETETEIEEQEIEDEESDESENGESILVFKGEKGSIDLKYKGKGKITIHIDLDDHEVTIDRSFLNLDAFIH